MHKTANTVLVIDREPQIRRYLTAGLELHGYLVIEAENGVAGLNAMTRIRPDLIILDPALPDMNGATSSRRYGPGQTFLSSFYRSSPRKSIRSSFCEAAQTIT
jgi:CheY-like chemotaxis protein